MRPPARAIVGNLVWSTDGGVWALWRVAPFALGYLTPAARQPVQARLHELVAALPPGSTLLSVCERIDPMDVAVDMADEVDLLRHDAWNEACELTADWLTRAPLYRRRHYVGMRLPDTRRAWRDVLRDAAADVGALFGVGPTPVSQAEIDLRQAQADQLEDRLALHVRVQPLSAGEVCWLYTRALRREAADPPFDESWEPPDAPHGVWARLTDAVVKEGGDDPDGKESPRQRRYLRIDGPGGTAYQTVFALADMPHHVAAGDGPGDWLYRADDVGFPVDWCVRIGMVATGEAGTPGGPPGRGPAGGSAAGPRTPGGPPPPDDPLARLGRGNGEPADPEEPEREVTVLLSVAAPDLAELEERATALTELFEPREYGLARPTRDQAALWRSMLPGTAPAPACSPYTQFMPPAELAAGAPFCSPDVGDLRGLLLGVSLDGGTGTPVLLDPALGFRTPATPSLAVVGAPDTGKSFLLKRLCWDTLARGGQVVAIDSTPDGEYARFAAAAPGPAQVLALEPGGRLSLDPLRDPAAGEEADDERLGIALSFLSLLVGCPPESDDALALAQAIEVVADRPGTRLHDVVDELARRGARSGGARAAGLARRLTPHRESPAGELVFGPGRAPSLATELDADLVVLRLPDLALPGPPAWHASHPEQAMGQALLFLTVALAQRMARRDPARFVVTLCDGAGPLLASPHGQRLVLDAMRDGHRHNSALWLASPRPDDLAVPELDDLLGPRFAFHQAPPDVPAALRFLGIEDSPQAVATLEEGLGTGRCLFRDVHHRVGLVHVLPPLQPDLEQAFEKVPRAAEGEPPALDAGDEVEMLPPPPPPAMPEPEPLEVVAMPTASNAVPTGIRGDDRGAGSRHRDAAVVPRHQGRRSRRPTPLAQALQEQDDQ